jgi:hypothetical protein
MSIEKHNPFLYFYNVAKYKNTCNIKIVLNREEFLKTIQNLPWRTEVFAYKNGYLSYSTPCEFDLIISVFCDNKIKRTKNGWWGYASSFDQELITFQDWFNSLPSLKEIQPKLLCLLPICDVSEDPFQTLKRKIYDMYRISSDALTFNDLQQSVTKQVKNTVARKDLFETLTNIKTLYDEHRESMTQFTLLQNKNQNIQLENQKIMEHNRAEQKRVDDRRRLILHIKQISENYFREVLDIRKRGSQSSDIYLFCT